MLDAGIITGGLSLLGGLFGKKKEKTETTSTVDYVKMAANATKAGFNPLTALRAGGSAGFATTTTTGMGVSPLGAALSALGESIGGGLLPQQKNDPIKVATTKPSTALVDYQLRKANGPSAGRLYPVSSTTGGKVVSSRPASKGFIGPPHPRDWVEKAGGYTAYVPVWDQSANRLVLHPNPNGAELEQIPVAPTMLAGNAATDVVVGVKDRVKRIAKEPLVKVRPATPDENARNKSAWHRGWLPSFSWN